MCLARAKVVDDLAVRQVKQGSETTRQCCPPPPNAATPRDFRTPPPPVIFRGVKNGVK